ncbi:hypothetical protein [Streptomyces sp. NPDC057413]|uniref:hypothetical protein n=1 Tax=unclassified Streptomyces TaxID=2593676 RepID=UPI00365148CC
MNDRTAAGEARALDTELLGIYLNDHLAGATAGVERVRHLTHAQRGTTLGAALRPVAAEIDQDRRSLLDIMRSVGVPVRRYKAYAGWLGEKAGRLKTNGRLVRRSPLSTLLELELLRLAVEGKTSGWQALRRLADVDPRLDAARLDELLDRAGGQQRTLEQLRARQTGETFTHPGQAPPLRSG